MACEQKNIQELILLPPDSEDQNLDTDTKDDGHLVEPVGKMEVVFDKENVEDESLLKQIENLFEGHLPQV